MLETILFGLKESLKEVRLGNYVWDELLIYLAELCKKVTILEINSTGLTDAAISHLLKRAESLEKLDISGLLNFTGLAF